LAQTRADDFREFAFRVDSISIIRDAGLMPFDMADGKNQLISDLPKG
jgi:hypothetical protein